MGENKKCNRLLEIQEINEFSRIKMVPDAAITSSILAEVATLNEVSELEKSFREIISDPTETPHGPTEIADILSTHIHVRGVKCFAGFVLKGKSFSKVKSSNVTHQFAKLRTIPNIGLMVFAAVGNIQDDAQRDFVQVACDANCDYLILNAHQCARLLIAYEKICPKDGTPFDDKGICRQNHHLDNGITLDMTVREKIKYTIVRQEDVSHGGAKRYSANVILDRHYSREIIQDIVREVTEKLKKSYYYRNEQVKARWGNTPAHVVWLFVGFDLKDTENTNWACRTCWVDPHLTKERRPLSFEGNDFIDNIKIDWNSQYEEMNALFNEQQVDKGDFLEQLLSIKNQMITLADKAKLLFSQYQQGIIDEALLISKIQLLGKEIDRLYNLSSDLPLPPSDCKDFDQVCQNIFATVHDMFLFYSTHGLVTWEKPNREWLMQNALKHYEDDLQKLAFEEKKIH